MSFRFETLQHRLAWLLLLGNTLSLVCYPAAVLSYAGLYRLRFSGEGFDHWFWEWQHFLVPVALLLPAVIHWQRRQRLASPWARELTASGHYRDGCSITDVLDARAARKYWLAYQHRLALAMAILSLPWLELLDTRLMIDFECESHIYRRSLAEYLITVAAICVAILSHCPRRRLVLGVATRAQPLNAVRDLARG